MNDKISHQPESSLPEALPPDLIANPPQVKSHEVDWCIENKEQIEAYNRWAKQRTTFSAIVSEWREQSQSQSTQ
jgi:hypothetical protein